MCYRPLINKLKKNVNALSIVRGVSFSRALSMLYFLRSKYNFYIVKKKFSRVPITVLWMNIFEIERSPHRLIGCLKFVEV